jgi:hypothetical protein
MRIPKIGVLRVIASFPAFPDPATMQEAAAELGDTNALASLKCPSQLLDANSTLLSMLGKVRAALLSSQPEDTSQVILGEASN